jgi:pimeloyl-ACP methyl ester carboxylesterase
LRPDFPDRRLLHRFIAFDLPGHGESSNAIDPMRSYTRPGFADATVELLEKLGVTEAIVSVGRSADISASRW